MESKIEQYPEQLLQKATATQNEQEQDTKKKRSILKPKQQSAEELSMSSKTSVGQEHPKSSSAPETAAQRKSSTKSKSSTNGSGSKNISPKTRKLSLKTIIYRQLMAAGGQGIGVGIDKDLPIPARIRPPLRIPKAATDGNSVKKTSNKTSSSSASKTISSDSSSDAIPEHFKSDIAGS